MTDELAWRLCECASYDCDCLVATDEEMTADDIDTLAIWLATWRHSPRMERGEA